MKKGRKVDQGPCLLQKAARNDAQRAKWAIIERSAGICGHVIRSCVGMSNVWRNGHQPMKQQV
jgi:hypothetical protein